MIYLTNRKKGLIYFQQILQNIPGRCPSIFSISLEKLSVPYNQQTPAASTKTTKRIDSPGPYTFIRYTKCIPP